MSADSALIWLPSDLFLSPTLLEPPPACAPSTRHFYLSHPHTRLCLCLCLCLRLQISTTITPQTSRTTRTSPAVAAVTRYQISLPCDCEDRVTSHSRWTAINRFIYHPIPSPNTILRTPLRPTTTETVYDINTQRVVCLIPIPKGVVFWHIPIFSQSVLRLCKRSFPCTATANTHIPITLPPTR